MSPPFDLASIFVAHAKVRTAMPESDDINRLLRGAYERGCVRWPGVALPAEMYIRHMAARLPESARDLPLEKVLQQVLHDDLYLACACSERVPLAFETFDREYMAKLSPLLSRRFAPDVIDEILQNVRDRFLVGPPDGRPDISLYEGRGRLRQMLLVAAFRAGSDRVGHGGHVIDLEEIVDHVFAPGLDPELEALKRNSREVLGSCVRDALATLSPKDRSLVRLHFLDGVPMVDIGRLFGVSQPTISRWVQTIRKKVRNELERLLRERHHIGSKEIKSFLATLGSRLDLPISEIFRSDADDGDENP
jgi:RNA polymerase sigma-70 factor (ECF subfamily)